jgi:pyruvate dehydrogenase E1 component
VTLAPEGGAHQSITTPSIGLEQPGCLSYEPAFALDTEWCLLGALGQLGRPDGRSAYLRLSTRPVDQALAAIPEDPADRERRRREVVAGAYVLRRAPAPVVTLVAMGAVVPEVLAAADRLGGLGLPADVVVVTNPGLLFRALQSRRGLDDAPTWVLDVALPAERALPMVTVLDGHPHTLAFLAGVRGVEASHLGVTRFGQSGDLDSVYRYHGLDTDTVVGAALDLVD